MLNTRLYMRACESQKVIRSSLGDLTSGFRQQMRWELKDAKKTAEKWRARYILAVDRWRNTYQYALEFREAVTAMYIEFLALQLTAKLFLQEIPEFRDRIHNVLESKRVWRNHQALS